MGGTGNTTNPSTPSDSLYYHTDKANRQSKEKNSSLEREKGVMQVLVAWGEGLGANRANGKKKKKNGQEVSQYNDVFNQNSSM